MTDVLLDLGIDLAHGAARRVALEDALRTAVRSGRLAAGSALPSTRALATDLGVSRSTVVAAYEQLVAEGYLTASRGSATRVRDSLPETVDDVEVDLFGPNPLHDFRPGEPDPSTFPRARWMQSTRRVMRTAADTAFSYPDPRGVTELRSVLADQLARTRSVVATTSSLRIVGGFAAGLGFLGEMLRHRGVERIAVEDPMFPFHADVLALTGLQVVPIPLDTEGIDIQRLRDADVGAVLVTPAHQYPTGVTMSAERRGELVAWARDADTWIIEDDYDGEFRYDRRPIGALQGLAPDRVVYAGTASKSLAPALRLGWLVVPKTLQRDLLRVTHMRAGVSALEQLVLADFVERGELDRHVRQMRGRYRARQVALREVIAETAPWLRVAETAAGLHVMANIANPQRATVQLDEAKVLAAAAAASVGLLGLSTDHRSDAAGQGLAIGFSRPPEHHFRTALEHLAAVFEQLSA